MVRYPKLEPNPMRSWLLNARLRRSGALRSQACKGIPGAATTWVGRVTVALFCLVCLIWTTKNYPKLDFGQPTSRKPSELFGPDSWGRPDWRTRGVDAFKAVDRAHFWIRGRACGGVCETTRTRRRICEVELLRIVSATYVLFFPHEYQQNRRTIYNGVVYNIYIYTCTDMYCFIWSDFKYNKHDSYLFQSCLWAWVKGPGNQNLAHFQSTTPIPFGCPSWT